MASKTYTREFECLVSAARMFKALCSDSHNFMPKAFPQYVKSAELVQGDCVAAGAVKQINYFADGNVSSSVKHKVEEIDEEKFYYKYTIEGDLFVEKLESVVVETKFEPTSTGCVAKVTSHLHVKARAEPEEEKLKIGEEKMAKIYKGVEEYLKANPQVYA